MVSASRPKRRVVEFRQSGYGCLANVPRIGGHEGQDPHGQGRELVLPLDPFGRGAVSRARPQAVGDCHGRNDGVGPEKAVAQQARAIVMLDEPAVALTQIDSPDAVEHFEWRKRDRLRAQLGFVHQYRETRGIDGRTGQDHRKRLADSDGRGRCAPPAAQGILFLRRGRRRGLPGGRPRGPEEDGHAGGTAAKTHSPGQHWQRTWEANRGQYVQIQGRGVLLHMAPGIRTMRAAV